MLPQFVVTSLQIYCLMSAGLGVVSGMGDSPSSTCPADFDLKGDSCYKFIKETKTHAAAAIACANMNAFLAEPTTVKKNNAVREVINDANGDIVKKKTYTIGVWLGAKAIIINGKSVFFWTTQRGPARGQLINNSDTRWAKGSGSDKSSIQPNNHRGNQMCLQYMLSTQNGVGWNDENCADRDPYICQTYTLGQKHAVCNANRPCVASLQCTQGLCCDVTEENHGSVCGEPTPPSSSVHSALVVVLIVIAVLLVLGGGYLWYDHTYGSEASPPVRRRRTQHRLNRPSFKIQADRKFSSMFN